MTKMFGSIQPPPSMGPIKKSHRIDDILHNRIGKMDESDCTKPFRIDTITLHSAKTEINNNNSRVIVDSTSKDSSPSPPPPRNLLAEKLLLAEIQNNKQQGGQNMVSPPDSFSSSSSSRESPVSTFPIIPPEIPHHGRQIPHGLNFTNGRNSAHSYSQIPNSSLLYSAGGSHYNYGSPGLVSSVINSNSNTNGGHYLTGSGPTSHNYSIDPQLIPPPSGNHPTPPNPNVASYYSALLAYPALLLNLQEQQHRLQQSAAAVAAAVNTSYYGYPLHTFQSLSAGSKRKGGQIRFAASQTAKLEKAFADNKYLQANARKELAQSLHLTDRQVKTWFQNRRAKWRKSNAGESHLPLDNPEFKPKNHPVSMQVLGSGPSSASSSIMNEYNSESIHSMDSEHSS